jgi:porin
MRCQVIRFLVFGSLCIGFDTSSANADGLPTDTVSPYQLRLLYTGEGWETAKGGSQRGELYMQTMNVKLKVDAEKAFGWTGGSAVFEGYYASSRSINKQYVYSIDSISPIDTYGSQRFALYQAYYNQQIGSNDFLLGFWDPQQEFANTEQQNLFLNRNFTWNTALDDSGLSLQYAGNYPWTTLAFRAKHALDEKWTVQAAVLNGMADTNKDPSATDLQIKNHTGLLGIAEVNYVQDIRTKAYIGVWAYTGKQQEYNEFNADGSQRWIYGSQGGYIGASMRVYNQDARRGMDVFGNIGIADSRVTALNRAFNAGVTYTGLLDFRPRDKSGIAIAVNGGSDPYLKSLEADGTSIHHLETNIELTHHAKINDWLVVQPSVQYVMNPYFTRVNDALIFGLHFELKQWFGL